MLATREALGWPFLAPRSCWVPHQHNPRASSASPVALPLQKPPMWSSARGKAAFGTEGDRAQRRVFHAWNPSQGTRQDLRNPAGDALQNCRHTRELYLVANDWRIARATAYLIRSDTIPTSAPKTYRNCNRYRLHPSLPGNWCSPNHLRWDRL